MSKLIVFFKEIKRAGAHLPAHAKLAQRIRAVGGKFCCKV